MSDVQNEIRGLRDRIDEIDLQLIALLVQRARYAVRIGALKADADFPVVEPKREKQVLERAEKLRAPPLDKAGLQRIFKAIMLTMRGLQTVPPQAAERSSAPRARRSKP